MTAISVRWVHTYLIKLVLSEITCQMYATCHATCDIALVGARSYVCHWVYCYIHYFSYYKCCTKYKITYDSTFSLITWSKFQSLNFQNFKKTFIPDMPLILHRTFIVPSSGCLVIFNMSNFTKAYFKWPTNLNMDIVDMKNCKPLNKHLK